MNQRPKHPYLKLELMLLATFIMALITINTMIRNKAISISEPPSAGTTTILDSTWKYWNGEEKRYPFSTDSYFIRIRGGNFVAEYVREDGFSTIILDYPINPMTQYVFPLHQETVENGVTGNRVIAFGVWEMDGKYWLKEYFSEPLFVPLSEWDEFDIQDHIR